MNNGNCLRGSAEAAKQYIRHAFETEQDVDYYITKMPWLPEVLIKQGKTIDFFKARSMKQNNERDLRSITQCWKDGSQDFKHILSVSTQDITEQKILSIAETAGLYMTKAGIFLPVTSNNTYGCLYVATLQLPGGIMTTKSGETGNINQRSRNWLSKEEKAEGAKVVEVHHLHNIIFKRDRVIIENEILNRLNKLASPIKGKEYFAPKDISPTDAIAVSESVCQEKGFTIDPKDMPKMNALKNVINEKLKTEP